MQKGFAVSSIGTPLLTQISPTVLEIIIACSVLSSRYGIEIGVSLFGLLTTYTVYGGLTAKHIVSLREKSLKAGNEAYQNFCTALAQYKNMRDFNKYDETIQGVQQALDNMIKADISATLRPMQIGMGHITLSRLMMLVGVLMVGLSVEEGRYTVEDWIVLVGYLNQLSTYLPSFGTAINQLFASYPDLRFVVGELLQPDEVLDNHPDVPLIINPNEMPSIEFDDVTFTYPIKEGDEAKPPIVTNLSFTIMPGQRIAFVSESGAGKTTLFNLLYGYYTPDSGLIKINDQVISEVSLFDLQKHIGLIGQTPNLFKGSIRDNIRYGADSANNRSDETIMTLAASVNLRDFLMSFPDGLDTDVGENGKKLSGGQQQKVAILRALMKPCQIRLLDEVTAPFDSQSATEVLQGIFALPDQPTTLMITHKLTEAQSADVIIVLDKGRCIATGTHDELLISCDLYQRLWSNYTNAQSQDEISTISLRK